MKRIAFLGKTGSGKSSLVNALFGLDFPTGNTCATTLDLQSAEVVLRGLRGGPELYAQIVDTPGFAESQQTEANYRRLYSELLPSVDHVVWVVQSHPRVFRPDQEALIAVRDNFSASISLTVALTRADSIGPNNWDDIAGRPSAEQQESLRLQQENVFGKLAPYAPRLRRADIVPCAAPRGYGLSAIAEHIYDALRCTAVNRCGRLLRKLHSEERA